MTIQIEQSKTLQQELDNTKEELGLCRRAKLDLAQVKAKFDRAEKDLQDANNHLMQFQEEIKL
eukprot:CAMPEP_0113864684 /NCGR_PEP_ID=MMETSP0372-20130328/17499_1 /TAXON_ID=340204 /ORGANISM="Lankesteria abbotti" /LENGTH=62 /DNA_ID=CAMNT_0000847965 /DNA_START=30 /DNA_END=214 /DNA_ORIENTATION=+ /assembly_acc=CAM_ASM_000359